VQYDHINISCLVDVEGKDLASFLIEDVDKLYVDDVASIISMKAKSIKSKKGF
jgi:hypothetical protein